MADPDLLLTLYAGISSDEALGRFLAALALRFDCCSAALFYVDRRRPAATFSLAHGRLAESDVQSLYIEKYAVLDPAPQAMARLAVGDVASTDRIFTGRALRKHREFLEGFYHAVGLGGALGGPLIRSEGRVGMIAVQRGLERAQFDDGDILRFKALMPFVIQALDLRQRFFEAGTALSRLEAALAPVTVGVMAFDQGAVLQHANAAARALLARRDALFLDPAGYLHADHPAAERALRSCFARFDAREGGNIIAVPRGQHVGPAYAVRITRFHARGRSRQGGGGGFTALISDAGRAVSDGTFLIGAAFGLSPEAARLTAALVAGDDLSTFAERAGISVNTAKYHLKMAFAATGARRQTDLVRLALTLVHDLG